MDLTGWSVRQTEDGAVVAGPDGTAWTVTAGLENPTRDRPTAWSNRMMLRGGRVRDGFPALISVRGADPVGCPTAVRSPTRRASHTRTLALPDRTYTFEHTTDRRAVLRRDGRPLARLYRTWQVRGLHRLPTDQDLGFSVRETADLDPLDEAMVVTFGAVLGPPGRPGAVESLVGDWWT